MSCTKTILLLLLLSTGLRPAHAQVPGADFTPTDSQIDAMRAVNTTMLHLMELAPGNFHDQKAALIGNFDGTAIYHIASPNPAMALALETISEPNKNQSIYAALFRGRAAADFAFAAFMMMPHYYKNDSTFKIEAIQSEKPGKSAWFLLMEGTKIGYFEYRKGEKTEGILEIGMF